jgi:hypothetical protein
MDAAASPRGAVRPSAAAAVPRREAPSQADFDREEDATRAEFSASPSPSPSAPATGAPTVAAPEAEAKEAAYHRAVERAMEYCRPQAELASRYFNETARAIYIDAKEACRVLRAEHIEADVVAVIDGGTRVVISACTGDRGHPKPGRDLSFASYLNRYMERRRSGLSHQDALAELERVGSL